METAEDTGKRKPEEVDGDELPEEEEHVERSIKLSTSDKQGKVRRNKNWENSVLSFQDVKFTVVDKKGNTREILRGLTGFARPYELVAIMGSSGAGKTTLFNIISGRQTSGPSVTVSGKLNVLGMEYELGPESIQYDVAYVMQMDLLPATSTVFEHFRFSARLRMPNFLVEEKIVERANEMCEIMGLVNAKDSMIGNQQIAGISGGQKKRVSVGAELIPDPDFLYCDEPTTGLDSHTALLLCRTFRDLAKKGHTVIIVIHQPSADVFFTFDTLWLLSRGKFVYNGPTTDVQDFFDDLAAGGHGEQMPEGQNIADHLISCIYFDEDLPEESEKRIVGYIDAWKKEEENQGDQLTHYLNPKARMVKQHRSTVGNIKPNAGQKPGWGVQTIELFRRELLELKRNPFIMRARFAQSVFTAILAGIVFLDLSSKYRRGLSDRLGGLFFLVLSNGMQSLSNNVLNFPLAKLVFERERKNNMYATTPYLFAKNIVMLVELIFPIIISTIVKPMMGLDIPWGDIYVVNLLLVFASGSLGMLIGAIAPSATVAVQIVPGFLIPLILLCGFFVTLGAVPGALRWIADVNFIRYALDALVMAEFKGNTYECEPGVCPVTSVCVTQRTNGDLYYEGDCFIHVDRDLNNFLITDDFGLWVALIFILGLSFKICACGHIIRENGL